jgi:hypothetical protein
MSMIRKKKSSGEGKGRGGIQGDGDFWVKT